MNVDIIGMHNQTPIVVHAPDACAGRSCCVHNPSDHPMRGFPQYYRFDIGLMERTCPHGIGHPDPDDLAYRRDRYGADHARGLGIHGCDGCCRDAYPLS